MPAAGIPSPLVFATPRATNFVIHITIYNIAKLNKIYIFIIVPSETPADEPEPTVEEPVTPEADTEAPVEATPEGEDAADVSEDEKAEPDLTDEE